MSKLSKKTKWIIVIAAVVLLALILFLALKKGKHTELQINTVRSTIDSVEVTVTATGELQPVYKVDVGTQVSGIVEHIYVDFNTVVKKGQKLAERNVPAGEVILGVRPEHMVLAKADDHNAIPATLEVNEMMGSELHLHVFTEDGTRLIVRVPTIGLEHEERESLVNGKKMAVTFEGKVMHFFDPETEKNLLL